MYRIYPIVTNFDLFVLLVALFFRSKTSERLFLLFLERSNNHQWTFDQQTPRSKVHYKQSFDGGTSTLIVPNFDVQVDSGVYECLSTNTFGSASKEIVVDKKTVIAATTLFSKRKRQEYNAIVVNQENVS